MKPVFPEGPLEGTGILQSLSEPGGRFFHIVVLACCLAWMSLAGVLGFPPGSAPKRSQKPGQPQPPGARGVARGSLRFLVAWTVAGRGCAVQGAVPEELRNEERTRDSRKLPGMEKTHSIEKSSDTVHAIASGHSSPSTLPRPNTEMGPVCGGQREAFHTWLPSKSWCISFDLFHEMFLRNAK